MSTTLKLSHQFQPFAGNRQTIEVEGETVKQCLDYMVSLYPVFRELLFDDDGILIALVIMEGKTIVPKDVDEPVTSRKEIVVLPMVQGG